MPQRLSVLIVDDDADIREAVAEVLSDEGYATETARNGREALATLKAARPAPALILLDLMMPELDGYGFMRELAGLPELSGIPVIVFSAHGIDAAAVTMHNVRGFLKKPLRLQDLLELVGSAAG